MEGARFPNLVALYWGLVDHNGISPTQRDFARAVAEDPLVRKRRREAVLAGAAREP